MIDLDGLERVRDQLWAEAVHQFKRGARGGLKRRNSKHSRPPSKTARFVVDAWEEPFANGWEIASTSVSGRCSNTHSGSPASNGRSRPRSEFPDLDAHGLRKGTDHARPEGASIATSETPSPQKIDRLTGDHG